MTNEQLVLRIRAGENVGENMRQLWEQNQGLICSIARSLHRPEDYEDLCQQGYLGLSRAVDLYYNEQGSSFYNYASYWIRQSMIRYIKTNLQPIRIPEVMLSKVINYRRFVEQYEREQLRPPTDSEICSALKVKQKSLEKIKAAAEVAEVGSLNSSIKLEDRETDLQEAVPDPRDRIEEATEKICQEELQCDLWEAIEALPEDHRYVIRAYFQEDKTLKEIASELGVTQYGSQTMYKKALAKLKANDKDGKLYSYLYSEGIKGTGVKAFERTWTSATERAAIGY